MQESDISGLGHPPDTWADMRGWGKGLLWVNGFNLGWYWPLLGPQMRIYVPGPLLRAGSNEILLLEFAQVPEDATGAMSTADLALGWGLPAVHMLIQVEMACVVCGPVSSSLEEAAHNLKWVM